MTSMEQNVTAIYIWIAIYAMFFIACGLSNPFVYSGVFLFADSVCIIHHTSALITITLSFIIPIKYACVFLEALQELQCLVHSQMFMSVLMSFSFSFHCLFDGHRN